MDFQILVVPRSRLASSRCSNNPVNVNRLRCSNHGFASRCHSCSQCSCTGCSNACCAIHIGSLLQIKIESTIRFHQTCNETRNESGAANFVLVYPPDILDGLYENAAAVLHNMCTLCNDFDPIYFDGSVWMQSSLGIPRTRGGELETNPEIK